MVIKEEVLESVKQNGLLLASYTDYMNDRDVVLAAVMNNGLSLQYASDELKRDKDVVQEAVEENKRSFIHAYNMSAFSSLEEKENNWLRLSDQEKNDAIQSALSVTKRFSSMIDHFPESLKKATLLESIAYATVLNEENFVSVKDDKTFFQEAIKRNPDVFKYSGEQLKKDKNLFCQFLIAQSKQSNKNQTELEKNIESDSFTTIEELLLYTLSKLDNNASPKFLEVLSKEYKKDREFFLKAIQINDQSILHADNSLKYDRDYMLDLIESTHAIFSQAHKFMITNTTLKVDREFCIDATKRNKKVFVFLDDTLKEDIKIIQYVKEALLEKQEVSGLGRDITDMLKQYLSIGETFRISCLCKQSCNKIVETISTNKCSYEDYNNISCQESGFEQQDCLGDVQDSKF